MNVSLLFSTSSNIYGLTVVFNDTAGCAFLNYKIIFGIYLLWGNRYKDSKKIIEFKKHLTE